MRMLCLLALISADVREWLNSVEPVASLEAGGDLVDKIAAAALADGDTLATTAFMASLPAAEERLLTSLDLRHPLPNPLDRAKEIYSGLAVRQLTQQIEGLKNQLSRPGMRLDERLKIQKQILDLKIRVEDVHRPFQ